MPHFSRRLALLLLASTALSLPAAPVLAAKHTAAPEDQASRDPALKRVRDAALAAAKARDFAKLAPHLDPRIQLDFGGGTGAALLRKRLAERSALWDELIWVLAHGGRFDSRGAFTAPYTFSADTGDLDPFEAGILIGPATMRGAGRAKAEPLAIVRDTAVRVYDWRHSEKTPSPFYRRTDWIEIGLPDKRRGWVEAKHVRSAVDYRAGFEKKGGRWKMTFFIAGD